MPGTISVIAAGAFVQQGILPWHITVLIGLVCAIVGDSLSYGIGFYARDAIHRRFRGTSSWIQAEGAFQRWGPMSILLSRFLVTAIAIPVNLLAGTSSFPYTRFIVYDVAGEILWIILFALNIVIITIGEMILVPTSQTLAANFAPEDLRGRYMAVFGLAWAIPATIGPGAAGYIIDNFNPNLLWYLGGLLCAVSALAYYILHLRLSARPQFASAKKESQPA